MPAKKTAKKKATKPKVKPAIPTITGEEVSDFSEPIIPLETEKVAPMPKAGFVRVRVAMGKVVLNGVISKKGDIIEIEKSVFKGCDNQYELVL